MAGQKSKFSPLEHNVKNRFCSLLQVQEQKFSTRDYTHSSRIIKGVSSFGHDSFHTGRKDTFRGRSVGNQSFPLLIVVVGSVVILSGIHGLFKLFLRDLT